MTGETYLCFFKKFIKLKADRLQCEPIRLSSLITDKHLWLAIVTFQPWECWPMDHTKYIISLMLRGHKYTNPDRNFCLKTLATPLCVMMSHEIFYTSNKSIFAWHSSHHLEKGTNLKRHPLQYGPNVHWVTGWQVTGLAVSSFKVVWAEW